MFVRKLANGELILIAQTDHSRFVGQLAAHWGSSDFASPEPYDSVSRAATFHDFGWLRYETSPLIDVETGEPYEFRKTPFSQAQLDSYQWCIDWLGGIDRYSGILSGCTVLGYGRDVTVRLLTPQESTTRKGFGQKFRSSLAVTRIGSKVKLPILIKIPCG